MATDYGAYYDQQMAQERASNPYADKVTDPAAEAQRRAQFIQQQQDPAYQQQAAARNQQTNAYQTARDGALGMMLPGSMGANGVDYGKAQGDPSAALNSFLGSGYTGQQAMADGWGQGVGKSGWQNTPQSQQLNPNGGNMAAMAPGSPGWGQQAGAQGGGIYGQLGAQLGPQQAQPQQRATPMAPQAQDQGGGYSSYPGQQGGGNPFSSLTGPLPSSMGQGQSQGGNPFGALSSYLDQRSQGGYGGPSHQPAQLYNLGGPAKMVPASSLQVKPSVLSSLGQQLGTGPAQLNNLGAPKMAQMGAVKPGVLSALGSQLGGGQNSIAAPRTATLNPYAGIKAGF